MAEWIDKKEQVTKKKRRNKKRNCGYRLGDEHRQAAGTGKDGRVPLIFNMSNFRLPVFLLSQCRMFISSVTLWAA